MVLTDDNGWAGVGYNNPTVSTPALDALASGGLKLTSMYAYQFCAPTRSSFLTGRMPYKLAATRSNLNGGYIGALPDGTHLGYSMLPLKLKAAGYRSVHVGKWHQGLYAPAFSPVARGFDESFGFLEGGEDHNTSECFGSHGEVDLSYGAAPAPLPACTWQALPGVALHNFYDNSSVDIGGYNPWRPSSYDNETGCARLCANRVDCAGYTWRSADPTHDMFHKCFLISLTAASGVANTAFQSALCTREPLANTTWTARDLVGTYTGDSFSAYAVRAIERVPTDGRPLFMYLALHNTHAPLEAPWSFVAPFAKPWADEGGLHDGRRQNFNGMLSFVDETVANVTSALRRTGVWADTLLVWTTDNGSPVTVGGSNHPLRGGKGSNWEGGTRVPAFVTGGWLPTSQAGKVHNGLIHIADWHTTFCQLAGVDASAAEPKAPAPLDGLDAWPWLSGRAVHSSRTELVYDHNMFGHSSGGGAANCGRQINVSGVPRCLKGALAVHGWKLVVGPEHQNGWFGWFSPNASAPLLKNDTRLTSVACYPEPCLYDLNTSMTEHDDVAGSHPDVMSKLLARFDELAYEYHPPMNDPPLDLDGFLAAVRLNGGFVGPWMAQPLEEVGAWDPTA